MIKRKGTIVPFLFLMTAVQKSMKLVSDMDDLDWSGNQKILDRKESVGYLYVQEPISMPEYAQTNAGM